MKTFVFVHSAPVLLLTKKPDMTGTVIPPHAKVILQKVTPVFFGPADEEHYAGTSIIRKDGNKFVADFTLVTTMEDLNKSKRLIEKLYPCVCFDVLEAEDVAGITHFTELKVTHLTLTPHGNTDKNIPPFGSKVMLMPSKKEMQ